MVTDLVRAATPEEREYARLLDEIEKRKTIAVGLQQELAQLKAEIAAFEAEYHATIGPLYLEIDRLRTAIRQYELQIARLHDQPESAPETIERDVLDDMRAAWERVRQDEEENRAWQETRSKQQALPDLDPHEKEDLMRMYRELARRHHPDLARTEEERQQREPIMQRINEALTRRDTNLLRSLMTESEFLDSTFDEKPMGEKLVWAIREIARISELTVQIQGELATLRTSEIALLMSRQLGGEDFIGRLQASLDGEIADLSNQLSTLVSVWVKASS
jgi:hypothetical protein